MSEEMNQNPDEIQESSTPEQETANNEKEAVETTATETATDEAADEKDAVVENGKPEEPQEPEVAHDDFDWTKSHKHELPYSEKEIENYLEDYEKTLSSLGENEIVKGKVAAITDSDVILDLNFKSDGLVSRSEFRDMPDLEVGDSVDVYVELQEDEKGQLVL